LANEVLHNLIINLQTRALAVRVCCLTSHDRKGVGGIKAKPRFLTGAARCE